MLEPGEELPEEPQLLFAIAPARRGFVWRDLGLVAPARPSGLPPPRAARAPPRRQGARRASPTCAPATTSSTRITASASCSASRRRPSRASRATTSCSRSAARTGVYVPHEQLGKVSRYVGADAGAPALSKLGGKAWQTLKSRARESVRELAGELIQLYAQRADAGRLRVRPLRTSGSRGSRRRSRTARPRPGAARSRR